MFIRMNWKYASGVAIVFLIATGTVATYHGPGALFVPKATAANAVPLTEIDAATVLNQFITDYQTYSGRLEAVDKVEVRPLVSGTIVAVHFKDGSLVKKGDSLFTIDPRPFVAEVDRAGAQLAAALARNGYAGTDAARAAVASRQCDCEA